mgnify:CR=1 FL=1
MTKLCPRGKAAAKRKFKVYPSAYANAYASKICAGKIKDPSGVKRKDFRGPKPAAKGAMMTAGSQSAMGRLQKAKMVKAKRGTITNRMGKIDDPKSFLKRRMMLAGPKSALASQSDVAKKAARLGKKFVPKRVKALISLIGAAAAGAAGQKAIDKSKKVDKKKMGGLKAELNNPAKGYMAGGMADYYKDLM